MNYQIRDNINAHLAEFFEHMCRWIPGAHIETNHHYILVYTGASIAYFNLFLPTSQKALQSEVLADVAATFNSRGVPYIVAIEEEHMPGGAAILAGLGYQPLPPQLCMYLEGHPEKTEIKDEVYVERVGTVASLSAFWTRIANVFDFPMEEIRRIYPVQHLRDDLFRHYVSYLEDRPVGAGTAFCAEGMVSIWNLCTEDDFRKMGVATTMLVRMLGDAYASGYETSFLYSMPMEYNLVQRLGYRIYSHMQWHLQPGA